MAINICLEEFIGRVPHLYQLEWNLNTALPGFNSRRLDAVVKLGRNCFKELPIVLIEAGKEESITHLEHKDNAKMLGMLSATCINNAHELARVGNNPLLALTYGLLIGGSRTQLCIAQPVLTPTGNVRDGKPEFEIHSHVSCPEHWVFDLLSEEPTPLIPEIGSTCATGCCNSRSNAILAEMISSAQEPLGWAWTKQQRNFSDTGEINLADFIEEARYPLAAFNGNINVGTLHNLKSLFKGICKRMELLCNNSIDALKDHSGRFYVNSKQDGLIPKAKEINKTLVSPEKNRSRIIPPTQKRIVFSFRNANLFKRLSFENAIVFPIVTESRSRDGDAVELIFEPSIEAARSPFLVDMSDVYGSLASCIKVALDCLHNLHWYHQRIGASFAGQIKKIDFCYSLQTQTWKFFNLEAVLFGEINDEMRTQDLSALGKCFDELFFFTVMNLVLNGEEKPTAQASNSYQLFQHAIFDMKNGKFKTALQAISSFLKALRALHPEENCFKFDPIILNIKTLLAEQRSEKEPLEVKIGAQVRSPRIEENPIIRNQPQ